MTAPQVTTPRHPWELLLQQLTGRMGILHGFGTEDDAKRAPWDRITWIPETPNFEPCPFDLPGGRVVELFVVQFSVPIYGGSFLEVCQRARDLDGWIFTISGRPQGTAGDPTATPPVDPQPGYNVRTKGKPTTGGDLPAGTWRLELAVTLKDFARSEIRPMLVVGEVDLMATALAGQGASDDGVMSAAVQGA